jgi:hypothetical protein
MKKYLLILVVFILLFYAKNGQAQHKSYDSYDKKGFRHFDTTVNDNYCLELIKQGEKKPFLTRYIIKMRQDEISERIYKPREEAIKLFGKECVIIVEMKPNVQIIDLKGLLILYKIPKEFKNLLVFVDKFEITHPGTLVAVKSVVKNVEIVSDNETGLKFISITTTIPKDYRPIIN